LDGDDFGAAELPDDGLAADSHRNRGMPGSFGIRDALDERAIANLYETSSDSVPLCTLIHQPVVVAGADARMGSTIAALVASGVFSEHALAVGRERLNVGTDFIEN
jgi:hypothetical protein